MSDLDAARERHVGEHKCGGPWEDPDTIYINDCDAALFRDALDAMGEPSRRYQRLMDERNAARALAGELAEALRPYIPDGLPRHGQWSPAHEAARAALAKWEASR